VSTVAVITTLHTCSDGRIYHRETVSLADAGHSIVLVAPPLAPTDNTVFHRHVTHHPVVASLSGLAGRIEKWFRAVRITMASRADVWHLHDPELLVTFVPAKLVFRRRVRLVYDAHENLPVQLLQRRPSLVPAPAWKALCGFVRWVEDSLAAQCDVVVAATEGIAQRFDRRDRPALVVRNFPVATWTDVRPVDQSTVGRLRVIYVGGVAQRRGVKELVAAARLVEHEGIEITILGRWDDAELRESVLAAAPTNLTVIDQVPFDQVRDHLASSHVGVVCLHPTAHHQESLPVKLFEYFAFGLAVVASDFDSWDPIVRGSDAGLMVDPTDAGALANALRRLATDSEMRARFGANARKAALEKYSWKSESKVLLSGYNSIGVTGAPGSSPEAEALGGTDLPSLPKGPINTGFVRQSIAVLRAIQKLPKVTLNVWGGPTERAAFERFNQRHPKLPIVRLKSIGVALLEKPDSFDEYLSGKKRQYLRRKINRATRDGYTASRIEALEHLDAMMAIHESAGNRQGRALDAEYVDRAQVTSVASQPGLHCVGVFDANQNLAAYCLVVPFGDVAIASRLLGHEDHLESGVMYLLFAELVKQLMAGAIGSGSSNWLLYDTFLGASEGLRRFKNEVGFMPYRITWKWTGTSTP
jgi:glycosyltransferase involved in cell wall biosynthesis